MCSVFWLFWLSCHYLPSDRLERPLWGSLTMERDHVHKAQAEESLWLWQHCVIAAGLRQRTATRHVEQEPREWHRTHWPGWFVRPPILQVPLSYDSSFTGCQYANELPTRYHWSHTRREPPNLPVQSYPRLHTDKNITIFQQTATDYTSNVSYDVGKFFQSQLTFSVELTAI